VSESIELVRLNDIAFSSETQPRTEIRTEVVDAYCADIRNGDQFPPVTLYHDGEQYWIGDGFHRAMAFRSAGHDAVPAIVRPGGKREAILHAVGANAAHGLRRTNADKRRAVEKLLNDDEWSQWSDAEIARRCAVSQSLVSDLRRPLKSNLSDAPRKCADGRTINTANIGRKAAAVAVLEQDHHEPLGGQGSFFDADDEPEPRPAHARPKETDRNANVVHADFRVSDDPEAYYRDWAGGLKTYFPMRESYASLITEMQEVLAAWPS
jgi:hypothetical protein